MINGNKLTQEMEVGAVFNKIIMINLNKNLVKKMMILNN